MADKKYPWEENLDWYKPSGAVQDAYTQYDSLIGQKPGDYQSAWDSQIADLYGQITNRPAFSYDLNADALYNQYKEQYQRLGNRAMQDTIGQASALTGGYGSTYGQTAGQQQYNQYMEQLNNIVPQLEQNAYGRYRDEGQDLYNLYGMASQREQSDYGRYQDAFTNWMNQQQMAYGQYMDALGFDYGQQQDQRNQANWQTQFDYGKQRDLVGDQQWQAQFDYGKQQDQRNQANWQTQFDYGKQRDLVGDQQWQAQFDYGKQQDAQSQANWEKQFNYGMKTDEQKQAFSLAMTALQAGKMPPDALLAQAGIDAETANMLAEIYRPVMGDVSGGSGSRGGKTNKSGDQYQLTETQVGAAFYAYQNQGSAGLDTYLNKLGAEKVPAAALADIASAVQSSTTPVDWSTRGDNYYTTKEKYGKSFGGR